MEFGLYLIKQRRSIIDRRFFKYFNGIHISDSSLVFEEKLSLIDPQCNSECGISQVFHCDGILLCHTTKNYRFVAWNPFTGKTRWIQPRNYHMMRRELYALGYDNKELCHSYKILRFVDEYYLTVEIYEFSSNSWRNLDVSPDGYLESGGVSLKGNTYWISKPRRVKGYSLLSFDFSTERFQRLSVLPFQETWFPDAMALSVVREERLSLLYQSAETGNIEIWVSNEIETTLVSWCKFLTVDYKTHLHMFTSPVSFFIDEEKKVAVCCDNNRYNMVYIVEEQGMQHCSVSPKLISLGQTSCWPTVFGYVPRLV